MKNVEQNLEANKIKALVIRPGEKPCLEDIVPDGPSLERIIDGTLECCMPFEEVVAVFCDCEGKLRGKPLNRAFRDSAGSLFDICAGTFIIAGMDKDNGGLISLSPTHIKKFSEQFKYPETFVCVDGKLKVISIKEEKTYEK